jgi:hypothetical protein
MFGETVREGDCRLREEQRRACSIRACFGPPEIEAESLRRAELVAPHFPI